MRAQGVGTILLEEIITRARAQGGEALKVYTSCDATGAQRFYQRRGFESIGVMADEITIQEGCKGTEPVFALIL
jgi:ribosomal protein S18 acetylase RimI-like enzyme